MAETQLAANRMTLLTIKKQLATAQRGHKLLKDKQDGLMQEFLKIVKTAKQLRLDIEKKINEANPIFWEAQSLSPRAFITNALSVPFQDILLEVKTKNVMSVKIPQFNLKSTPRDNTYGIYQTKGDLDIAIKKFAKIFESLVLLAQIEKSLENIAADIEKTRRRVNALEHHIIPGIQSSLKYIRMKLDENERASIVQTMAIKDLIEKAELENSDK